MKKKVVTQEEFIEVYNDLKTYPTIKDVSDELGIAPRTIRKRVQKYRESGVDVVSRRIKREDQGATTAEDLRLAERVRNLKREIRVLEKKALESDVLKRLIHGEQDYQFAKSPRWLAKKKSKSVKGIPTLMVSDLHYDEVVSPEQIQFTNSFNRDIAERRTKRIFENTVDVLFNQLSNPKYEGIVVALAGDICSGNIHDELKETNEDAILASLLSVTSLFIDCFDYLLKYFNKIFVPCVVGNHSRLTRKPRAKNKVKDNFEWLLYHFLAKHYKDNKKIVFHVSDSSDLSFKVYDKTFLLTHGDQFRGGNSIAGIFSPLLRGMLKKQVRQNSVDKPFDVLLIGHFHQYIHTNNLIVNGCFPPGQQASSYDGICNIEDIEKGSFVLTHDSNYMEVEDTTRREYDGPLVKIKTYLPKKKLLVTPEHLIKAIKSENVQSSRFGRKFQFSKDGDEWISARDLAVGDFVKICDTNDIMYKHLIRFRRQLLFANGEVYCEVEKVSTVQYKGIVHNLEVYGDNSYVINGIAVHNSIKGYDEYAWECNFPLEAPQQALWINHPQYGMIHRTPIFCEGDKKKKHKTSILII